MLLYQPPLECGDLSPLLVAPLELFRLAKYFVVNWAGEVTITL
jgi:hypothetical protein